MPHTSSHDFFEISKEERQYYREVYGFDPIVEKQTFGSPKHVADQEKNPYRAIYRYETQFPLLADPPLNAIGVQIGARVDVDRAGNIFNRILFKKGKGEELVRCTHVVVYSGSPPRAEEFASKIESHSPAMQNGTQLDEPESLPPWGHFVALKSYVAALAEEGIGKLLANSGTYARDQINPEQWNDNSFGFNVAMQAQIIRALSHLAPSEMRPVMRDWMMELVDLAPVEWLSSRRKLFAQEFSDGDLGRRLIEGGDYYILRESLSDILKDAPDEWIASRRDKMAAFFGVPFTNQYIPPAVRELCRTRWGFDPAQDRRPHIVGNLWRGWQGDELESEEYSVDETRDYSYQAELPIQCDEELRASNVTVCARVDVRARQPEVWTYLGFGKGGEKCLAECSKTYFSQGPQKEISDTILQTARFHTLVSRPPWVLYATLRAISGEASTKGISLLFPPLQSYGQKELFSILEDAEPKHANSMKYAWFSQVIQGPQDSRENQEIWAWLNKIVLNFEDFFQEFLAAVPREWMLEHLHQIINGIPDQFLRQILKPIFIEWIH